MGPLVLLFMVYELIPGLFGQVGPRNFSSPGCHPSGCVPDPGPRGFTPPSFIPLKTAPCYQQPATFDPFTVDATSILRRPMSMRAHFLTNKHNYSNVNACYCNKMWVDAMNNTLLIELAGSDNLNFLKPYIHLRRRLISKVGCIIQTTMWRSTKTPNSTNARNGGL